MLSEMYLHQLLFYIGGFAFFHKSIIFRDLYKFNFRKKKLQKNLSKKKKKKVFFDFCVKFEFSKINQL